MEETKIEKLLNLTNINDLFAFIKEYAAKNSGFKKELEDYLDRVCLSENNTKVFDLRQDVLGAVDESVEEGRYHEWFNLREFDMRLDAIAEDAENLMEMGNPEPALAVGVQMLESLGDAFEEHQPDDSYGYASDIFERAKELIVSSAKHPNMKRETLEDYFDEIEHDEDIDKLHPYGFDSKEELLLQLAPLTKTPEERLDMLNQFIKSCKSEYELSKFVQQKIDTLLELNHKSDAQKTIQQYIGIPEIRSVAVDNAMLEKDYETALSLIEEGLVIARNINHYGTERDWMKRRLKVYETMGNRENQIASAKELFVSENFAQEYYTKLKSLVPQQEWKQSLFDIIDNIPQKFRERWMDNIAAIYIQEKEWERLYSLVVDGVKTQIDKLDEYAKYFIKEHSEEMLRIYNDKLRWEAAQGTGRDRYESIAHSMRVMQSLEGGHAVAHDLAEFFRKTYRNRRAMMEIISDF